MELILILGTTFLLLALIYYFCLRPRPLSLHTTRDDFIDHFPDVAPNRRYINRLFKKDSARDQPGNIYVFRKCPKGAVSPLKPDRKHDYKVGRTERSVEERVREQAKVNEEDYYIERKIKTKMNHAFENLLHILLDEYRAPRPVRNGGSEWFRVSLAEIDEDIAKVNKHLNSVWGCS